MSLNENIRKLRTAKGISQVEFAKHLGVTKQCVSNWENDNILPSIEMLIKIAAYFSVSTDSVLGLATTKTLSVDGLSDQEIAHVRAIIQDLLALKK
ncbi:MAG: helix-turn-helix transcriptional regulator [Clostridiales bacterium]|nr:helix-turn-helix transcriptional regulator [Clostridiales bacterium]